MIDDDLPAGANPQSMTPTALDVAAGPVGESRFVRAVLMTLGLGFVGLVIFVPVLAVFAKALENGIGPYFAVLTESETLSAVRLTLSTAAIVVPANAAFGLAAGWAIGKFDFRGKAILVALIEVPLAVSPVISGLVFVLALGPHSVAGSWLLDHGIRVIFAWPGIVLATAFVTFSYVAREVIVALEAGGRDQEEAAMVLGASGWQTFWKVTVPNIRWALLYGVVLCNARAMGEFGAVSVVSGHVRGETNTLPLHVELLYDDYRTSAAFAVASLLVFLAAATVVAKAILESKHPRKAPS
jgi:sulfate transport system permease protein